jgi:hypothetical protein
MKPGPGYGNFCHWFEAQFGGRPNHQRALELPALIAGKKEELSRLTREYTRETILMQTWTACLYARNAFGFRRSGGKEKS